MKKFFAILAILAVTTSPAMAGFTGGTFYWADGGGVHTFNGVGQVTLNWFNGNSSGGTGGGAFSVAGTLTGYTTPASTYCIESQIHFNLGTSYWASVDPRAFAGGQINGDPVSDVTENTYGNWLLQNDTGAHNLGFADLAAMNSAAGQTAISQAIWWAEGESGGVKNSVANLMLAALGYNVNTATPGSLNAATHVQALNLWTFGDSQTTQNGITGWWASDMQSQLIKTSAFIPVPLPGAALLGLLGLGTVGWVKRRFA
jgi:hypothetical protein